MAYKAYLNNTELFFDSSAQDESFFLSYAMLDLEAGSAGDFTFRIPPDHPFYDSFHQLVDFVDVFRDGERIFTGRVYSITEETDTQRLISCEGLLALLADSVFRPITFEGTLHDLVDDILNSHNSQVNFEKILAPGNLTITDSAVYREYLNYETSASRMRDLVSSFGGYLSISKETGIPNSIVDVDIVDVGVVDVGTGIRLSLNWVNDFTDGCQQVIELNSNLIKIEKTEESSDIITALVPVGATLDDGSVVTIKSVNNGLDYIVADAAYVNKYGLIFGTERWSDVNVPSILKTKAQNRLNAILAPRLNIELTAADLADAGLESDAFRIGQKITVKSDPHNIDYVQFNCQKQELNLLHPEQNKLTLGEAKPGYVQVNSRSPIDSQVGVLSQMFTSRSIVQSAIDTATSLISGNEGGYVVLHDSDGDTYPDEILIMDTPDINTAVRVWRWNASGLGYSSTGYNGTFALAMTADGQIVADFITAGTLSGDRVRTGLIESEDGDSYWDLDNGEINFNDTFTVDAAGNVVANSLTSTNATITGGSIQMETAQDDETFIRFKGNGVTSTLSPSQLLAYTNDYTTLPYGSNMGQFHSSGVTLWNYENIIGNFTVQNLLSGLQCQFYMNNKSGSTVKQGLMINSSYDNGASITLFPKGTDSYGRIVISTSDGTIKLYNTSNTNTVTINRTGDITCTSLHVNGSITSTGSNVANLSYTVVSTF